MTVDIIRSYKTGLTKFGFSRRRGLTTVVTAALMLTAVAVLGSAMVAWSNSNLKTYDLALTTSAANNTNKITENVAIENIVFCNCGGSKNVINVTLTNTGTIGVNINQIQVNSTIINQYSPSQNSLPANILPQQSYTVAAKLPTNVIWKSKEPDTITVTTSRGSILTTQAAPP